MPTSLSTSDEVIIPTPCWVSALIRQDMKGQFATFQTTEENHFKATNSWKHGQIKTKVVLLNSPSNPTE